MQQSWDGRHVVFSRDIQRSLRVTRRGRIVTAAVFALAFGVAVWAVVGLVLHYS